MFVLFIVVVVLFLGFFFKWVIVLSQKVCACKGKFLLPMSPLEVCFHCTYLDMGH